MANEPTPAEVGSNAGLGPTQELLAAFDAYARSLVRRPRAMRPEHWPNHWPFFKAGWDAAVAAERERIANWLESQNGNRDQREHAEKLAGMLRRESRGA